MPPTSLGASDYERALAAAGLTDIAVVHHPTTGSTNDDARTVVSSPFLAAGTGIVIVVAETQTRGRGRGSNVWLSPGGCIALTISAPGIPASRLGILPLGVGTSVAGALRRLGAAAALKWPNDVLIEDRKVGGILCESNLLSGTARVFIGIGINVEDGQGDGPLIPGATTLAAHGIVAERPALVADITARAVSLFRGEASNAQIVTDWKALSVPWWGEDVAFVEGGSERRVTLLDVSPEGRLVVRDEGGVVRSMASGEVRRLRASRT